MKKILCFGDSNTFGFNPIDFSRYDKAIRWSGILSNKFNIIEAGCNNRCIFNNSGNFNSLKTLPKHLTDDLDYIILQVGINDLQFGYNVSLETFKNKLVELLGLINPKVKVILLCPNVISQSILNSYFSTLFDESSIEKSKKLPEIYREVSKNFNCLYINLNNIVKVSEIDGLHYDSKNHKILADYLSTQFYQN